MTLGFLVQYATPLWSWSSTARTRRRPCLSARFRAMRRSRGPGRVVLALTSPSSGVGVDLIDVDEDIVRQRAEDPLALDEPEAVPSPSVLTPDAEIEHRVQPETGIGPAGGSLEKLRKIGIAGSHTMYRLAEDIRGMMQPSEEVLERLPSRILSSHLAVDGVLVFGLFLLLRYGVSRVLYFLYHKLDPNRGKVSYKESVFECMQRPLEFLSVFTVGTSIAEAVARPLSATGATRFLRVSRELGVILAATWFLLRWIEKIRSRFSKDSRVDKTHVDSISRLATVLTVVVAILVMMDTIGLQVQSVLAFGGIGGVAIGFAGREIISNFFAGFMLFLTRPFSVGDWIRSILNHSILLLDQTSRSHSIEHPAVEGTVEDMGWYMTMIRTWEKRPLYVPNSRFSTFIIENPSRMTNRRIKHEVHLRLEDVNVVKSIIKEVESMLIKHDDLDPRQHRLTFVDRFDRHSIVLWVSCYTRTVFLAEYRKTQQDILLKIHDIIRMYGARLASDLYRDLREGHNTDIYAPISADMAITGSAVRDTDVGTTAPKTEKVSHVEANGVNSENEAKRKEATVMNTPSTTPATVSSASPSERAAGVGEMKIIGGDAAASTKEAKDEVPRAKEKSTQLHPSDSEQDSGEHEKNGLGEKRGAGVHADHSPGNPQTDATTRPAGTVRQAVVAGVQVEAKQEQPSPRSPFEKPGAAAEGKIRSEDGDGVRAGGAAEKESGMATSRNGQAGQPLQSGQASQAGQSAQSAQAVPVGQSAQSTHPPPPPPAGQMRIVGERASPKSSASSRSDGKQGGTDKALPKEEIAVVKTAKSEKDERQTEDVSAETPQPSAAAPVSAPLGEMRIIGERSRVERKVTTDSKSETP